MLLLLLVYVDANILLSVLARRSAVLALVAEAETTSLIGRSVGCLGCWHILLLVMWWLSATTSRAPRLPAVITLSSVIASAHVPKAAAFVAGAASTGLIWMVAASGGGDVTGARAELRIG